MVLFIIVILFVIYYVFSDLVPAYRRKNYRTILVYLILMITALFFNILLLINIKIPSISDVIKSFLEIFIKFDY